MGFWVLFLLEVSLGKFLRCVVNAFFRSFLMSSLIAPLMFSICFQFYFELQIRGVFVFSSFLHLLMLIFDEDLDVTGLPFQNFLPMTQKIFCGSGLVRMSKI